MVVKRAFKTFSWLLVFFIIQSIAIGYASEIEDKIELLKSWNYKDKVAVVKYLGRTKNKKVVEPLIAALKDKDWKVRESAAEALGRIGDVRAVDPLIKAFKDRDGLVKDYAVALGEIGDVRAVKSLIEALKDKDPYIRSIAAEALGEIRDVRAVEPLIAVLQDKDEDIRRGAAKALKNIGEPAVTPLINALKHETKNLRFGIYIELLDILGEIKTGVNRIFSISIVLFIATLFILPLYIYQYLKKRKADLEGILKMADRYMRKGKLLKAEKYYKRIITALET